MRTEARWISGVLVVSLAALLATTVGLAVVHGQAEHVRWDIISLGTPPAINPDGVAFAAARSPSTLTIMLTGSGTFVAPASGGTSNAVTGGGTWATFSAGAMTGSGTYEVTSLSSWQFANFQAGGPPDNIGPNGTNGNAVLRIRYSDGSEGILGIGCHGPAAPPGIVEGVIATKDFVTYWDAAAPVAGVDANRTSFHIE